MKMTIQEILVSLESDVYLGLYFEIDSEDAKTLLDYIRSLESTTLPPENQAKIDQLALIEPKR